MERKRRNYVGLASCVALLAACDGRLAVLQPGIADAGGQSSQGGTGTIDTLPDLVDPTPMPMGDCQDRFKNGAESDVDCGGPACSACAVESTCTGHPDCESGVCRAGVCRAPACDDGLQNGDETGLDCGGACDAQGKPCQTQIALSACNCASSDGLVAVACGPALDVNGSVFVAADGGTLTFALQPRVAYRWAAASGVEQLEEPGLHSPVGMSDDGTVILLSGPYRGAPSDSAGFLWTAAGARTDISGSDVHALSADGTVVLGSFDDPESSGFLWKVGGEAEPIRDLSTARYLATFMTPDGAFVGGRRTTDSGVDGSQLFRWSSANGAESLGKVPNWAAAYRNNGVVFSRDGSTIAGFAAQSELADAESLNQIFRWTEATGIVVLAVLWSNAGALASVTGDYTPDTRLWLNDDGSALVGTYDLDTGNALPQPSAFRWTEAGGSVALAATAGQQSIVRDASGDLNVVVGYTFPEQEPFVWNTASGMRELRQALADAAVALDGWVLGKPAALSRDGKVVVGEGLCDGVPAVYRAVLPE